LQVAALFPPGTTAAAIRRCFTGLQSEARKLGVTITGGDTEVTAAVTRPVLVGNMLGFVPRRRLMSTADARPGDVLVMAGAAGIEGSAILARDHGLQIAEALAMRHDVRLSGSRSSLEPPWCERPVSEVRRWHGSCLRAVGERIKGYELNRGRRQGN